MTLVYSHLNSTHPLSILASGGADHFVNLWRCNPSAHENNDENTQPVILLTELDVHVEHVNCVRWSPDHRYLASGSDDRSVTIWRLTSDGSRIDQISNCRVSAPVYDLSWRPCSAFSSSDNTANSSIQSLIAGLEDNTTAVITVHSADLSKDDRGKVEVVQTLQNVHKQMVCGTLWGVRLRNNANPGLLTLSHDQSLCLWANNQDNHGPPSIAPVHKGNLTGMQAQPQRSPWNRLPGEEQASTPGTHRSTWTHLFLKETQSFFRRPSATSEGLLIAVPAGIGAGPRVNVTHIFSFAVKGGKGTPVWSLRSSTAAHSTVTKFFPTEISLLNKFTSRFHLLAIGLVDGTVELWLIPVTLGHHVQPTRIFSCIKLHSESITDLSWIVSDSSSTHTNTTLPAMKQSPSITSSPGKETPIIDLESSDPPIIDPREMCNYHNEDKAVPVMDRSSLNTSKARGRKVECLSIDPSDISDSSTLYKTKFATRVELEPATIQDKGQSTTAPPGPCLVVSSSDGYVSFTTLQDCIA